MEKLQKGCHNRYHRRGFSKEVNEVRKKCHSILFLITYLLPFSPPPADRYHSPHLVQQRYTVVDLDTTLMLYHYYIYIHVCACALRFILLTV